MQYILTEDEYKALKSDADRGRRLEGKTVVHMTTKQLQALCTKIADTMPIKRKWDPKADPRPWGCMITVEKEMTEEGVSPAEWYCDDCPVSALCPHTGKSWSK